MSYMTIVEKKRKALELASCEKIARDVASLLDGNLLVFDEKDYGWEENMHSRENLFHLFCACCLKSGIPSPPMESLFWEAWLPRFKYYDKEEARKQKTAKAKAFREDIQGRLKGNRRKGATICRALAMVREMFPAADNEYGSNAIKPKQLEACINAQLVAMGLEPLRPDYASWPLPDVSRFSAPKKMAKVVVVDDNPRDVYKTIRALIGWPNLTADYYLQQEGPSCAEVAAAVIAMEPHIVLMDEGLQKMGGDDLVKEIRRTSVKEIIFVANTGGQGDKLRSVGCLENCEKGDRLNGLRRAIDYLG